MQHESHPGAQKPLSRHAHVGKQFRRTTILFLIILALLWAILIVQYSASI